MTIGSYMHVGKLRNDPDRIGEAFVHYNSYATGEFVK
jgi:hypothetical protein